MNRGRRAKDTEVAEVTVDMQSLKSGSETEDWYHLTGVTPIGKLTNTLYGSFLYYFATLLPPPLDVRPWESSKLIV